MHCVVVQRREAVFEIMLNRPEVLNAANRELIGELAAATAEAAEDRSARVVLLRGAGTHFCAGGDITMFGELVGLPPVERRKALYRIVDGLHPLLIHLRHMPKPVVAAVQGAAAGVGLSLVAAADLAFAAEDAIFTSGYIHLGTSPDGGLTALLARAVGLKHAAELMLLGERFDAPRALQLGLVNRLVPSAALEAEAMGSRRGWPAVRPTLTRAPKPCSRRPSATPSMRSFAARPKASPPAPRPRSSSRGAGHFSKSASPILQI